MKCDDGYWDEALTLIGGTYRGYHLSGQQLLAISYDVVNDEDEVYYFDDIKSYSSSSSSRSSSSSNNHMIIDVEDCFPTPTQMPSLSSSPSILTYPTPTPTYRGTFGNTAIGGGIYRTAYPTVSNLKCEDPLVPSSLLSESYVSPPTTDSCYLLDIAIAYDDDPSFMSWDVQLVDDVGGSDNVVLKVHKGVPDDAK
jgi:hypothetical protein